MKYVSTMHIPLVLRLLGLPPDAEHLGLEVVDETHLRITVDYQGQISWATYPGLASVRFSANMTHVISVVQPDLALYRDLRCMIEGVQ